MIDLHLSQLTVQLSVGCDEEAVQTGSITNWKRGPTYARRREAARYDRGSGDVCRDDIIGWFRATIRLQLLPEQ